MLKSYLIGGFTVALLTLAWAGVQIAWRRAFPGVSPDPDVLAHRMGCHGCAGKTPCQERCRREATLPKEKP